MVCTRRACGKFVLMAEKSPEISKLAGNFRIPPAAGSLPAEQGALCAADSLACGLEVGIHANFGRALKHHPIFRYGGGAAETTDQADRAQDRATPVSCAGLDLRIQEQRPTRRKLVFFPMIE